MQNGGFYSATDADSNGEEGLFFIWNLQELKAILGADFVEFQRYFELSNATEFEQNFVIHLKDINKIQAVDIIIIETLLVKLYQVRQKNCK
jgi:uncharacterized protein YyaL (SSP411 family)